MAPGDSIGNAAGMADSRNLWDEQAEPPPPTGADERGPAVAVALAYDPADAAAPKVVATGRGFIAEQILQFAFAHGVKVRTDPDLAQVLSVVDIYTVIPVEAFMAVAEILAYVYRANGRMPPSPPSPS